MMNQQEYRRRIMLRSGSINSYVLRVSSGAGTNYVITLDFLHANQSSRQVVISGVSGDAIPDTITDTAGLITLAGTGAIVCPPNTTIGGAVVANGSTQKVFNGVTKSFEIVANLANLYGDITITTTNSAGTSVATISNFAIVEIPFSHNGTGNGGNYVVTHTYRSGCSHVPVIDLGTGNATYTTLSLNTPDSGIIAANNAKHTVCAWAHSELTCFFNGLTALDISKCAMLTRLFCYYNSLTSLGVSTNTALSTLHCAFNPITSLGVSTNTALSILSCYNTSITALDVSTNTALTSLRCEGSLFNDAGIDALIAGMDSVAWTTTARVLNISSMANASDINTGTTCTSLGNLASKGWVINYEKGNCDVTSA